jgi:mono/diheme cytochrome c family protein
MVNFLAMRKTIFGLAMVLLLAAAAALTGGCSNSPSGPASAAGPAGQAAAGGGVDYKTMRNTVPTSAKSLESGKRLYTRFCAECHGVTGDGASEMAAILVKSGKIPPPDLTDDNWDLGSTDGEIFKIIRDGSGSNMAMKGLNGRPGIVDEDIWNIVNYVRSLHK